MHDRHPFDCALSRSGLLSRRDLRLRSPRVEDPSAKLAAAGVAFKLGRRFLIRSAIIVTTLVNGLLGMAKVM